MGKATIFVMMLPLTSSGGSVCLLRLLAGKCFSSKLRRSGPLVHISIDRMQVNPPNNRSSGLSADFMGLHFSSFVPYFKTAGSFAMRLPEHF